MEKLYECYNDFALGTNNEIEKNTFKYGRRQMVFGNLTTKLTLPFGYSLKILVHVTEETASP